VNLFSVSLNEWHTYSIAVYGEIGGGSYTRFEWYIDGELKDTYVITVPRRPLQPHFGHRNSEYEIDNVAITGGKCYAW
jgi:hypothetical protein